MARWLSGDEQVIWRNWLDVLARQVERFDEELLASVDLSLTDYEILVFLSEADGRELRMSELARRLIVSRSRVTYRVDRLVRRGLVARRGVPDDKRGRVAILTDDGFATLRAAAPGHVDLVRRLVFDQLEPHEIETFASIVGRLADAANTDHP